MTKTVGDIAINVTADIGPLVKGMGRATRETSKLGRASDQLGRKLQGFSRKTARLGKQLSIVSGAIAGATAAAFGLAKSTAEAGDEIAKTSRGAGVSAEYFQEMEFAIGQVSDLSKGDFSQALQRLNRTIGEAADGSKSAAGALDQLGFSQSQIASGSITTQQAFDAYIKKMDGLKDPAIAAAVSSDLLGRSGARLGAQLAGAQGSVSGLRERAQELGIVLSKDTLKASEGFKDQMDSLKKSFDGVLLKIGGDLLPLFSNTLLPLIQDKVVPKLREFGKSVGKVIDWFTGLPGPVQEAAGVIAMAFAAAGPVMLGIAAVSSAFGLLVAATGPIGLFAAAAVALTVAWSKWGDDIKTAIGGAVDWIKDKFAGFMEYIRTIPDQLLQIGQDMIQGLIDGIMLKWEELKTRVYEMAAALPEWMREFLGIQSPSRVFMEIGGFIGEGLAQGIANSQAMVEQAVRTLGGAAIAGSKNTANGVLSNMQTMFQGSKKISAGIALANSWLSFTEVLKDPSFIGRPWARIAAAGAALASGLNAVRNIKSASVGGGSGGAAGATPAPVQTAPPDRRVAEYNVQGSNVRGLGELIDDINEAVNQGYEIRLGYS